MEVFSDLTRMTFQNSNGQDTLDKFPTILLTKQDNAFVQEYISTLTPIIDRRENLEMGHHLGLVLKQSKCPVGLAVALLGVAIEMIEQHGVYMSSMDEIHNVIFVLVTAAQDAVLSYTRQKQNIALYFGLWFWL